MSTAARAQAPDVGGRGGPPGEGPRFALRFEDGRGRLSLAQPLRFALGTVDHLELDLGPLAFPLDLSAGPGRFRTRRTRVVRARVRVDLSAALGGWVEEPHEVRALAPARGGLSWALRDPFGTVAFETRARFEGPDLRVAIVDARSATEGPAAPLVRVHHAARALGLELDEGRGVLSAARALSAVLTEALVPYGWRAPDDRSCRLTLEVLGPRRVALATLDEGDEALVADDPAWERAQRLAPVIAALGRADAEGAQKAWRRLAERAGPSAADLALEAAALDMSKPPPGSSPPPGPVHRSVALRAAIREGRVADAAEHARALAAEEPCDAVAVEALCAAADLAADRDPEGAASLLDRAAARRPRDGRLALRLAGALARLGRLDDLERCVAGALAAADPGPARGELARDAAIVCELEGHHAMAERWWAAASEQLPRDARVLEGLGLARARGGDPAAALALLDRAAAAYRDDGEDAGALRSLRAAARAAWRDDRIEAAEARLTRVVEGGGAEAESWAALARMRRRLGAADAARRAEDRLLEALEGASAAVTVESAAEWITSALTEAARDALADDRLERARGLTDALARFRPDAEGIESLRSALDEIDLRERASAPERLFELDAARLVRVLEAADDPSAVIAAAGRRSRDLDRLARSAAAAGALVLDRPALAGPLAALVAAHAERVEDPDALFALAPHAPDDPARATLARAASERFRDADRPADAALALARAGAALRDTAMLRAALTAAERAGAKDIALTIVRLALDVVGDGPARAALEAMQRRLERD